jgi:Flp pilus assembly protein TadG
MRTIGSRSLQLNDHGAVAIEFAMLVPILLVLVSAAVIVFLLFESAKLSERATFTVGDIVSRRTTVDNTFLNTSYQLFLRMTNRSAVDVKFRVSSIKRQNGAYSIGWSYAVAPQTSLAVGDVPTTNMPLLSDGDSLLIVETIVKPPAVNSFVPISVADYNNVEFVRPRFTSAIVKTD